MRTLALQGINGGAGTTAVTAGLGAALHATGHPVLLIDLSPTNMLGRYFALPWTETAGLAPCLLAERPWHEAAFASEAGVNFVPFGQADPAEAISWLAQRTASEPAWLIHDLAQLALPDDAWVLIDLPCLLPDHLRPLAGQCDHQLRVINPDPASYLQMQQAGALPDAGHYLINRFDPLRTLERDLHDLVQADHAGRVVPTAIHRDEGIREALACRQTVVEAAPHSQATHDLATLAIWLRAHVGQVVENG